MKFNVSRALSISKEITPKDIEADEGRFLRKTFKVIRSAKYKGKKKKDIWTKSALIKLSG